MENNIFESVVVENADAANANTVLVLHLLVVVVPVVDSDTMGCGINQWTVEAMLFLQRIRI